MEIRRAAVLGTGAWGTTFAQVLADAGISVAMWGRNSEVVARINAHENPGFVPGIRLPADVRAMVDMEEAVGGADLVAVVVPVVAVRETVERAAPLLSESSALLCLSKGLELGSWKTMHQVILEASGLESSRAAILSGPNLSREIARRLPTATVVASEDTEMAADIALACHNSYFRPYVSRDVLGCEIAGATKNVMAVAIGAAEGLGMGTNSRSTLITRGLAEMTRLGTALGADPGTFAGLAGMGDLVATCSSQLSRNYSLGVRLGRGATMEEALAQSAGVAEGVRSARPILDLAHSRGVDMPITEGVVRVVHEGATAAEMGEMLMSRPQKMDGWRIEFL